MDLGKFLWTVDELIAELETVDAPTLIGELEQAVGRNSKEDIDRVLANAAVKLEDVLSDKLPPSRRKVVALVGGERLLGKTLLQRLRTIVLEYDIRPEHAVAVLGGIRQDLGLLARRLKRASEGLREAGVQPDVIEADQCEFGAIYPKSLTPTLDKFQGELRELDKHLRLLAELHGTPESPRLRKLASSALEVYVLLSPFLAKALLSAIEKILDSIKKVHEIRLLGLQIEKAKLELVKEQTLDQEKEQAREQGIEEAVAALLKDVPSSHDPRRTEVLNSAKPVAVYLARRISAGVVFEAWASPASSELGGSTRGLDSTGQLLGEVRKLGGVMNELLDYMRQGQLEAGEDVSLDKSEESSE